MDEASAINQEQTDQQQLNQLKEEIKDIKTGEPQTAPPVPQPPTSQPIQPVQPVASPPPPASSGKSKIVLWFAVALLVFSSLTVGAYFLGSKSKTPPSPSPTATPMTSPTATPTSSPTSNWETYSDTEGNFSFKYPSDISLRQETDGSVTLSLWGPSQKEGTEFYDGIYLSFKTEDSSGLTLENFINKRIDEIKVNEESVSATESASFGELDGYQFEATGLGQFTYIYLELTSDSFLEIVDGTIDPTNAGFEDTVQEILSTLESSCCSN
jgi:hypothetical protein